MTYKNTISANVHVVTDFTAVGKEIGKQLATRTGPQDGIDKVSWDLLTDSGFWQLGLPHTKADTLSWDRWTDAIENLSKSCGDLGFVLSAVAHAGIIRMVKLYGSAAQQNHFLPRLLEGEIAAMAITESTGGSDVPRIKLTACQSVNGYLLNGHKTHITNAPDAKIVLAVGRRTDLPSGRDICMFLLDTERDGISHGDNEVMIGHRGSSTGDLTFSSVFVTPGDMLEPTTNGLHDTYEMIALDRALYGLAASACLVPLIEAAMEHIHTRSSFGRLLSEYQLVQARVVDANTSYLTGRSLARTAVKAFLSGSPDRVMQCSTAKLVCTEGYVSGARNIMMVMGHCGYEEGPFSAAFCDAAGSCIAAGTTDIQKVNIFNSMSHEYSL